MRCLILGGLFLVLGLVSGVPIRVDPHHALDRRWGYGGIGSASHQEKYHANKAKLRKADAEIAGQFFRTDDELSGFAPNDHQILKAKKYMKFNEDRADGHRLAAELAEKKNARKKENWATLSPEDRSRKEKDLDELEAKHRDHKNRMNEQHGGRLGQAKKAVGHSWNIVKPKVGYYY